MFTTENILQSWMALISFNLLILQSFNLAINYNSSSIERHSTTLKDLPPKNMPIIKERVFAVF